MQVRIMLFSGIIFQDGNNQDHHIPEESILRTNLPSFFILFPYIQFSSYLFFFLPILPTHSLFVSFFYTHEHCTYTKKRIVLVYKYQALLFNVLRDMNAYKLFLYHVILIIVDAFVVEFCHCCLQVVYFDPAKKILSYGNGKWKRRQRYKIIPKSYRPVMPVCGINLEYFPQSHTNLLFFLLYRNAFVINLMNLEQSCFW